MSLLRRLGQRVLDALLSAIALSQRPAGPGHGPPPA
jgi:hypothetical protein